MDFSLLQKRLILNFSRNLAFLILHLYLTRVIAITYHWSIFINSKTLGAYVFGLSTGSLYEVIVVKSPYLFIIIINQETLWFLLGWH